MSLENIDQMLRDWGRFTPKIYNPDRTRNPVQNGPTSVFQINTSKHVPGKIRFRRPSARINWPHMDTREKGIYLTNAELFAEQLFFSSLTLKCVPLSHLRSNQ